MGPTNIFTFAGELKDKLAGMVAEDGQKVIAALLILAAGFIVSRWLGRMAQRWLHSQDMEPPVRTLLVRVIRLLLLLAVLVMTLETIGVKVTTLVAGIGVAGLGVGLALQGVLGNLVAGLSIIFTKPFRVGEYIELAGVQGQVKQIELFSTILTHADQSIVMIPNRKIVGEILHNYGKIRQLELSVNVAYGSDLPAVMAVLNEILSQNPLVLKSPSPGLGISALTDSAIKIAILPWTAVPDAGPAGAQIYSAIITRFKAKGIEIPIPKREIRMIGGNY